MASTKLTPKQVAQLAGFARARKAEKGEMAALGSRGGSTTLERHGREHFIVMAHRRWGRLGGKSKD